MIIQTSIGNIVLPEPKAYEIDANDNLSLLGFTPQYVLNGNTLSFSYGSYNTSEKLAIVIERALPAISSAANGNLWWSTFFGGDNFDWALDVIVDANNNSYLGGKTKSSQNPFPNTGTFSMSFLGLTDGFIAKFNNEAVLKWATYFGGSNIDAIQGLAYNPNADLNEGQIYAVGSTASSNIIIAPQTNPNNGTYYKNINSGNQDAFIARFNNSTGFLSWSSYIGGNNTEEGRSITCDHLGNVYITGNTASTSAQNNSCLATTGSQFPLCDPGNGAYYQNFNAGDLDIFITSFDSNNNLRWSTFYGSNQKDEVYEIHFATGPSDTGYDHIYITGKTEKQSPQGIYNGSVPTNGAFPLCDPMGSSDFFQIGKDGFISRFNPSGLLNWATNMNEIESFQTLSSYGDYIYVGGFSKTNGITSCTPISNNVPICDLQGGYYNNTGSMYIAKFDKTTLALKWSTLYNGWTNSYYPPNALATLSWAGFYHKILDMTTDNAGNLYVSGLSHDNLFDVQSSIPSGMYDQPLIGTGSSGSALPDAVLLSFNPNNSRVWATYFGAYAPSSSNSFTHPFYSDISSAIAVYNTHSLYLAGYAGAYSTNQFPLENPGVQPSGIPYFYTGNLSGNTFDAFISRFDLASLNVGVNENMLEKNDIKFHVYPNPGYDLLNVFLNFKESGTLKITNIMGQIISSYNLNQVQNTHIQINVDNLPIGLYIITFTSSEENESIKFIKK